MCGKLILSEVSLCNSHKTSALSSASDVLVAYLLLAVGVMKVHCGCKAFVHAVGVMKVQCGCKAFGVSCSSSLLLTVGVMKVQCGW